MDGRENNQYFAALAIPIQMIAENLIGFEDISQTIPHYCFESFRRHNKRDALAYKVEGVWNYLNGEAVIERVKHIALGLAALGVKAGDKVAIISENRPEWSFVDLAILSLRAVNVPIYTTQAVDQIRYIIENSGAKMLFVSGKKIWKHAEEAIRSVERLEKLVFFDADEMPEGESRAVSLADVESGADAYKKIDADVVERSLAEIDTADLATIIYTSGTTGEPKGVMLTHENFISNLTSIIVGLPISPADVSLSVLPLSHIFERSVFYVFCYVGVSVHYAASIEQVGEFLREVRPTIMTAVPRLFEKVYHRIVKKGMSAGGIKSKIFERSLGVGQRYAELKDKKQRIPLSLKARHAVADRLVFTKWRAGIGGRLRYFVSGGAPLSPTLSYSFLGAGINILQGYGMTETCIVCANRPEDNCVGSIGKPFAVIEVSIAADGEMLVRGGNAMRGYYGHPEATDVV